MVQEPYCVGGPGRRGFPVTWKGFPRRPAQIQARKTAVFQQIGRYFFMLSNWDFLSYECRDRLPAGTKPDAKQDPDMAIGKDERLGTFSALAFSVNIFTPTKTHKWLWKKLLALFIPKVQISKRWQAFHQLYSNQVITPLKETSVSYCYTLKNVLILPSCGYWKCQIFTELHPFSKMVFFWERGAK